jgi:hypothetical protein
LARSVVFNGPRAKRPDAGSTPAASTKLRIRIWAPPPRVGHERLARKTAPEHFQGRSALCIRDS